MSRTAASGSTSATMSPRGRRRLRATSATRCTSARGKRRDTHELTESAAGPRSGTVAVTRRVATGRPRPGFQGTPQNGAAATSRPEKSNQQYREPQVYGERQRTQCPAGAEEAETVQGRREGPGLEAVLQVRHPHRHAQGRPARRAGALREVEGRDPQRRIPRGRPGGPPARGRAGRGEGVEVDHGERPLLVQILLRRTRSSEGAVARQSAVSPSGLHLVSRAAIDETGRRHAHHPASASRGFRSGGWGSWPER